MPRSFEAGWIEHAGSRCPVALASRPAVRFRNGAMIDAGLQMASFWGERWIWMSPPSGFDIVAYAVEDCALCK